MTTFLMTTKEHAYPLAILDEEMLLSLDEVEDELGGNDPRDGYNLDPRDNPQFTCTCMIF